MLFLCFSNVKVVFGWISYIVWDDFFCSMTRSWDGNFLANKSGKWWESEGFRLGFLNLKLGVATGSTQLGGTIDHEWMLIVNKDPLLKMYTLPETNIAPKMDGWKMNFLLGNHICRGYVSFREGKPDDHSCLGVSGQTPGIPIMTYHVLIHFQRSWFLQLFSAKFHFEETKRKHRCIASLCFFSIYYFLLPMIVSLQVPPSKKKQHVFSVGLFRGHLFILGGWFNFQDLLERWAWFNLMNPTNMSD